MYAYFFQCHNFHSANSQNHANKTRHVGGDRKQAHTPEHIEKRDPKSSDNNSANTVRNTDNTKKQRADTTKSQDK